jgi:hypothetical protein
LPAVRPTNFPALTAGVTNTRLAMIGKHVNLLDIIDGDPDLAPEPDDEER